MKPSCPAENTLLEDQSKFFSLHDWSPHKIGWTIAGACTAVTVLITMVSVLKHCRNYTNPPQQRQILRILYMPPVYGIISFFSYRYFREYTYYELIEVAYEAVTLSAFVLLLIDFVASTASGHDVDKALARKEKKALPFPFWCWRYRPSKAYFMYTVKWSVLQYVIVRPAVSIAGIVCQYYGVLCASGSFSPYYAHVYLSATDFVSISVALYGLIVFYGLTKEELAGKRPLAKFMAIKLIVMFTFYQAFVFSALEGRVIHATDYWTTTNISDGLNALTTCIEMVLFSGFMMWAYTWKEYVQPGQPKTGIFKPLWDSVNYVDFVAEIWGSFKFYFDYARNKPGTHGVSNTFNERQYHPTPGIAGPGRKADFGEAFGINRHRGGILDQPAPASPNSYDENIRLAPYYATHRRDMSDPEAPRAL